MKQLTPKHLGQSTEDYLRAIFMLQTDGNSVSTTQLAEELGISAAAVSKAIQQLAHKGLLSYEPYRGVTLTEEGRLAALRMVRHHRLLEAFLHEILGYSWDEVDEEAEQLEHHVSARFLDRVDALLNYPRFDPHGDPIPTPEGDMPTQAGQFLAECDPGDRVNILWVRDVPEILQFLDGLGMRPGTGIHVMDKQPFQGPLTLQIGTNRFVIGREVAGYVFVELQ
ncbi:MAG: Transcriptional regulator MntR [Phycisphaerae bacterium]|nr:Transcriptional regulator MntR [Phycisphaerae bacterium]